MTFRDDDLTWLEAHGVPADRIVTTWPLDRLLDWARG